MARFVLFLFSFSLVIAGCASSGEVAVVTDRPVPPPSTETASEETSETPMPEANPYANIQAGRFDKGKMWTFDHPPLDYFEEAYGFRPDSNWFNKARAGALRFSTYCSASFVSPGGLVMTNHHCGRESVSAVSQEGENLLDVGFYASSLEEERKVEDLYVEQLISITDVTEQVYAAMNEVQGDDAQAQARQNRAEQIEQRMTATAQAQDSLLQVEVIELFNGGAYSAYTFKRYDDVRLVMAPELALGFFGGEPDNFTYPRYSLDMSFFRVYDEAGQPLTPQTYFPWNTEGAEEGDAVFVIGNPGSTSRLSTVSQLAFERDVNLPLQLEVLERRADYLETYVEENTEEAEAHDLRNTFFSIANTIKASRGQLGGLLDPAFMARRAAAERQMLEEAPDSLKQTIAGLLEDVEELQASKRVDAGRTKAFAFFGTELDSRIMTRALYGYYYDVLSRRGLGEEELAEIKEDALQFGDWPREVDQAFIEARFTEMQQALRADDPTLRRILGSRTPAQLAAHLAETSALADSAKYADLLEKGYLSSGDPTVEIIDAMAPLYFQFAQQQSGFADRESNLNARLARARFAIYGTTIPPDATFSLRIADGFVKGYEYNGTKAPPYTTFYGLYGHYYSYGAGSPWDLPERWLNASASFDRSTPINLVSTNDITGGNSGSPLLNQNLEVVGLIFDSNIDALPNEYIYQDEVGRAVSVDVRGMLEVLDDIYDADRLVLELTTGEVKATEAEADAARGM